MTHGCKLVGVNKDRLTKERRSWNMSRIRSKNTTPEMRVRSQLHRMGYRFRLHVKNLPGRPDIVLPKYRTVIFVHGCFWHRHNGCKNCTTPTNRRDWWLTKLNSNASRDKLHQAALKKLGWRVMVIWECEVERDDYVRILRRPTSSPQLAEQTSSRQPMSSCAIQDRHYLGIVNAKKSFDIKSARPLSQKPSRAEIRREEPPRSAPRATNRTTERSSQPRSHKSGKN